MGRCVVRTASMKHEVDVRRHKVFSLKPTYEDPYRKGAPLLVQLVCPIAPLGTAVQHYPAENWVQQYPAELLV